MNRHANGGRLTVLSWLTTTLWALYPARLLVCAAGLLATILIGQLALLFFDAPAGPAVTWPYPADSVQRLGIILGSTGLGRLLFRAALLAIPLWLVWSLVGGWIARSELLRRRRSDERTGLPLPVQTSATRLVGARGPSMFAPMLMIVAFVGILLLVELFPGALNRIPGAGAIFLALLLPALMALCLGIVVVLVGLPSLSIMPAAIAAEGSDSFDAVSRGYSYLYQRPVQFVWWWGLSLAISALPLAAVSLLLQEQAGPAESAGGWLAAAGAIVSLSLFWTLQTLVYVKLRRTVDDVAEDKVWDGPVSELRPAIALRAQNLEKDASGEKPNQPAVEAVARVADYTGSAAAELEQPKKSEISFPDTIGGSDATGRLITLLPGMLWASLILAGGVLLARHLAGLAPMPFEAGLRQALLQLGNDDPGTLLGIAVGIVVVGAFGMARPVKAAARSAAVQAGRQLRLPRQAARSFSQRMSWRGTVSVLLLTGGTELFLAALCLVGLAVQEMAPWTEACLLGGAGLALLGIGALSLAPLAVENPLRGDPSPSGIASAVGNGPETLASAALNLVMAAGQFALAAGVAWLTWFLLAESLSWWGGENVRWVRWGLDGRLVPESEGGLYYGACAIAGLWFVVGGLVVLAYPLSYALGWGVRSYLRARQQGRGIPPTQLNLTGEEEQALRAARQQAQARLARLKAKAASAKALNEHREHPSER